MNTEELALKLEQVKVPNIEFDYHREQLRRALLGTGAIDMARQMTCRDLWWRQSFWKPVLITSAVWLCVASAVTLGVLLPMLRENSAAAFAAEAVMKSAEVAEALAGSGITSVNVVGVQGRDVDILIGTTGDNIIKARVSQDGKVTIRTVTTITLIPPLYPLTQEETEKVLALARSNGLVQAILDLGAQIRVMGTDCLTVVHDLETETVTDSRQKLAFVILERGGDRWTFLVNPEAGDVTPRHKD